MSLYSIIISGYKPTTRQTLAACLALDVVDGVGFEILCCDNTARGSLRPAVEQLFDDADTQALRTLYLHNPEPGKVKTQNKAIKEAKGDTLIFLDDDVLPDPDLVVQYDKGFQAYSCSAVQGRVELEFVNGASPPSWLTDRFRLDLAEMDFGEVIIPFTMGLTGANMAFKAELFSRYGLFDERLGPARSGTLEDQEFSERIQAEGEVQLFLPTARVRHLIPPERLTVRSFAGIYFDVGHSDYMLSRDMVKGGRLRFSFYSLRQVVKHGAKSFASLLRCRRAEAILAFCEIMRAYGYWRQGIRAMTFDSGDSKPGVKHRSETEID